MTTFRVTKPECFKAFNLGIRLIDIVTILSLPTPFINGSEMSKFHKKGVSVIYIMEPGCETELNTKEIKFKTLHTDRDMGTHILMQELIACLCGCHSSSSRAITHTSSADAMRRGRSSSYLTTSWILCAHTSQS
jgi:hypothetical protein